MPPKPKTLPAALADQVRPWLTDHLGRPISERDVEQFKGLVGSLRSSRAALIEVTDGNLLHAAWLWEKRHENRGAIVFQLKARMNAKGVKRARKPRAPKLVATTEGSPVSREPGPPPWLEGTLTRPRGSTLTVPAADARSTLAALADGLPALRALGVHRIVLELEELGED